MKLLSEKPFQIIFYHEESKKWVISKKTAELLTQPSVADKKISVCGILGPMRQGKSFILNRLMGRETGFPLGHEMVAKTKGIWGWAALDGDRVLMALDSQGLDDPDCTESQENTIRVLTALLSSLLVLNMPSRIGREAVNSLKILGATAEKISSSGHKTFVPDLCVLLRDAYLHVPEGETLDSLINKRLSKGGEGLNKHFSSSSRLNLMLTKPTVRDEDLTKMDADPSVIKPEFIKQSNQVLKSIKAHMKEKRLYVGSSQQAQTVDSEVYYQWMEKTVNLINDNKDLTELPEYVDTIGQMYNDRVVARAFSQYRLQMNALNLPIEEGVVQKEHKSAVEACSLYLQNHAVGSDAQVKQAQTNLDEKLAHQLKDIHRENAQLSTQTCAKIASEKFGPVVSKLEKYNYSSVFQAEIEVQQAVQSYKKEAVGPSGDDVLQEKRSVTQLLIQKLTSKLQEKELVNAQKQREEEKKQYQQERRQLQAANSEYQKKVANLETDFQRLNNNTEDLRKKLRESEERRRQQQQKEMEERQERARREERSQLQGLLHVLQAHQQQNQVRQMAMQHPMQQMIQLPGQFGMGGFSIPASRSQPRSNRGHSSSSSSGLQRVLSDRYRGRGRPRNSDYDYV